LAGFQVTLIGRIWVILKLVDEHGDKLKGAFVVVSPDQ
jgi:hypothetical protein